MGTSRTKSQFAAGRGVFKEGELGIPFKGGPDKNQQIRNLFVIYFYLKSDLNGVSLSKLIENTSEMVKKVTCSLTFYSTWPKKIKND